MKKPLKKKPAPAKRKTPPKVEVGEPLRRPGRKRKPSIPPSPTEERKVFSQPDLRPAVATRERGLVPYDPLQMYLMEIRNFRLLTREEEIAL
jgi:hypothetical protein